MDKGVSARRFENLPEEVKARIIFGAGAVNRSHQEYMIDERIEDAGTKPFTNDELTWLVTVKRSVVLFYSYGPNARISLIGLSFYSSSPLIDMGSLDVIFHPIGKRIEYHNVEEIDYNYPFIIKAELIVKELTNCIDSSIIRKTCQNVLVAPSEIDEIGEFGDFGEYSDTTDQYYEEYECDYMPANITLTDVRTVFLILRRRFTLMELSNCIQLARIYTQRVLDRIMDDYQSLSRGALLGYLLLTAKSLELDVHNQVICDYGGIKLDSEEFMHLEKQCHELYLIITEEIKHMC